MKLQDAANHTLSIEYPGLTLEQGLIAAGLRVDDTYNSIQELEQELSRMQFVLDEQRQALHEANQAATLFLNALEERDEHV